MSEPAWLDAIKDAYMADRASVFLLHGPGTRARWTLDGVHDDFLDILVAFLSRTREVVGLLAPPQALRFPGIGDTGRFERMISAAELVAGKHTPLLDDVPEQALGKLWIALSDAATPQGYVVGAVEELYPQKRKRVLELAAGAPPLWEWATHPRIRATNHIVLLVASDLDQVRPELAAACEAIRVDVPGAASGDQDMDTAIVSLPDLEAEAPTVQPDAPPVRPRPPAASDEVDLEALADDLNSAIRSALATQGEEMRPARVPVMAGVAAILGERTGSPGPLQWSLDEDGNPVATGDGADEFLARWRSDIALDASAGMVIGKLAGDIPARLDDTGLRALAKRLARKFL